MNHLRYVAELLKVELGEKFNIVDDNNNPYFLTEKGLFNNQEDTSHDILVELLSGEKKIEKIPITDDEREFLMNILRVMPEEVVEIERTLGISFSFSADANDYYIKLYFAEGGCSYLTCWKKPLFKNMKKNRKYTLAELGLIENIEDRKDKKE